MIDKTKQIPVTNREFHPVGYTLLDNSGIYKTRRKFNAGQTLMIPYEELERLYYDRGGEVLLKNFLRIDDKEVAEQLLGDLEPEYFYGAEDVKNIVMKGSVDELKDMLDFGPEAVKDVATKVAIEEKIDSFDKREAIYEATGTNVTSTIELTKDLDPAPKKVEKTRRVNKDEEEVEEVPKKQRRTELPKYNVVS